MKYKCIVEYDYPVSHKTPFKAILYLHGDSVQTDRIKPFYDEEWVPRKRFQQLLENSMFLDEALRKHQKYEEEIVRCGECKYMMADGRCYEFADDSIKPSASDFCSYGERKEE